MTLKKLSFAASLIVATCAFAFPRGPGPAGRPPRRDPGFGPRPERVHPRPPHHSHGFWPGFAGGFAAGVLLESTRPPRPVPPPRTMCTTRIVEPAPVVVQQPIVVQQPVVSQTVIADVVVSGDPDGTERVWVEGSYFNRINADGSVTRVWNPGHYELRKVR